MLHRGFAQIVPLLTVVLLISSVGVVTSLRSENVQKQQVGVVLSESDDQEDEAEKKAQELKKEAEKKESESREEAEKSSSSSKTGSSTFKSKTISKTENSETEIETEDGKTKIKIKNADGEFETEIEDGKEKTKVKTGGYKIEYEREGEKYVAKVKNEQGEDVELEEDEKEDLFDDLEDELEDDGISIATGSAQLGFVQKGNKVRTNFPLSISPTTGQLFVTTPSGTKVVTVLPDVAIQNMIKAGIMTRTVEPPSPPSIPPESSGSSTEANTTPDLASTSVELTELNEEPVYIISGVKDQEFLGFIPVEVKVKTTVSATDGRLVDISQGILTRLLDLLSF